MLALALLALQAAAATPPPATAPPPPAVVTTRSGLRFQVLQPGTGRRPGLNDAVLVTYEGRLADGTVFDSVTEPVGLRVGQLIPGFTEALRMMNAGGRYRFWIPSNLAYGEVGSRGVVPPNAEVEFTLNLVRVGRPRPR